MPTNRKSYSKEHSPLLINFQWRLTGSRPTVLRLITFYCMNTTTTLLSSQQILHELVIFLCAQLQDIFGNFVKQINIYYEVLRYTNNNNHKQPLHAQDEISNIVSTEKQHAKIISHLSCHLLAPHSVPTNNQTFHGGWLLAILNI